MKNYEFWALLKDGTELKVQNLTKEEATKKSLEFTTKRRDFAYSWGTYEMSEETDKMHVSTKRVFGIKK